MEIFLVVFYFFAGTNVVAKEERIPYESLDACMEIAREMNKQPVRDLDGVPHRFEAGCNIVLELPL
jgi:hypothetical protein